MKEQNKIKVSPGPGDYNITSNNKPPFLHKFQPFGLSSPRFKKPKRNKPEEEELTPEEIALQESKRVR